MCCSKAVNFKKLVNYVTSVSTTTTIKKNLRDYKEKKKRPKCKRDY